MSRRVDPGRWRRRLAVSGLLATASLASACGSSPSTSASAPTTAPPTSSPITASVETSSSTTATSTVPPSTVDPTAIRAVDFLNFTYPAGACDPKDSRGPFVMSNGKPLLGEPAPGSNVPAFPMSVDEVIYGDVTGDGADDAAVVLICTKGGTAAWKIVDVFAPSASGPQRIGVLSPQASGPEVALVKIGRIQIANGAIVVEEIINRSEGGRDSALVTWNYKDGQMTTAAAGTPAPSQGLDPNRLTTDGIGELHFGDPLSKAEQLTGKRAKVYCGVGADPADVAEVGGVIDDALPGLSLIFKPGGSFVEYWVTNPEYTTPSGAHVGMSADELLRAVPYATKETGPQGSSVFAVHSEGNVLLFVMNGTSVRQITAGREDSAGFGC